jgi:hypothetical protein
MAENSVTQPGERFTAIFSALMVFCVLVWLWGLGLFMLWPWQKGGEWLPEFPIVAVCADDSVCAVPYGELAAAQAAGKVKTLTPPTEQGETAYEMIALQWTRLSGGVEAKASAWNFQTKVRYRIEDEKPILIEYQEIGGKVFLYAILGALVTLGILYLRKLKK